MKKSLGALALPPSRSARPPSPRSTSDFPEAVDNPVVIQLAGVWNSFDTQARLDVTRGGLVSVGTTLDLERSSASPRPRWTSGATARGVSRSGTTSTSATRP